MRIRHNIMAMNAKRNYGKNTSGLSKTLEKLSSGYQINRAADDAAGLAISEKMRAQITGLDQAQDNAKDGISLVQTADGALAEVHDMINRLYELAEQSSNGTLQDNPDRIQIQKEVDQITDEIDRIAKSTNFNGIPLLQGEDLPPVAEKPPVTTDPGVVIDETAGLPDWVDCGTSKDKGQLADSYITTEKYSAEFSEDGSTFSQITGTISVEHAAAKLNFANSKTPYPVEELIDKGFYSTCFTCNNHYTIRFVSDSQSSVEQSGNHYIYNISLDGVTTAEGVVNAIIAGTENGNPKGHYTKLVQDPGNPNMLIMYDQRSTNTQAEVQDEIRKTQNPPLSGGIFKNTILSGKYQFSGDYGCSADKKPDYGKFGFGVATAPAPAPDVEPAIPETYGKIILQIGTTAEEVLVILRPNAEISALGLDGLSVATQKDAFDSFPYIREAINLVSEARGRMGAYQNRLEHTINNLSVMQENIQNAESAIRDTDVADEMIEYTKKNILTQSAQAMLAQANQVPQGVLQLLQ